MDVYKEWLGIPAGTRPPDHYTLLRLVQFEDNIEKIRANYRKLNAHVRKYSTGQYLLRSQELLNEMAKAMLCLTDPDGKREYDESLGREPSAMNNDEPKTVMEYLVSKNLVKRSQVSEIERFAEARGLNHRDAVIQMKLVEPVEATRALAVELRLPFVDLEDMLPEDSVLDMIPRRVVKKHSCLPLFEDRGRMLVACIDEPSPALEDEIRMRCGHPMRAVLAVPRAVNQAISKYYAPGMRDEATASEEPEEKSSTKSDKPAKTKAEKPKAKAQSKSAPLSADERKERMQYSLIGICWATIGTVALLYFAHGQKSFTWDIPIGLVVGGIVAGILKATYWK
ncbi:MAG: general secretion pathway protein GspE [Fuerstia sp.]|nr:general secretion pathway protein GspE [Fuerstiella sp.]